MDAFVPLQPASAGTGRRRPGAPAAARPPVFLIVLCHGVEADSRQLAGLSAVWRGLFPNAAVLLQDAPETCRRQFGWTRGRQWWSLKLPREAQIEKAAGAAAWLNGRVDAELARLGLPLSEVVFCGFSQGAMAALLAGLQRPVAPLGIISIAGALMAPEDGFAVRCRPKVMLVHGAEDRLVPASRSEAAARRLRAAKIDVRLHILPLLGHLIVPDAAPFAAAFIDEFCA